MVKESKNTKAKKDVESKKNNKKVATKKVQKKEVKKVKKEGLFKKIGNWFKSVIKEVSKVKWTSKKDMLKYSIATIVFIIFFSLFFYAIELLMAFVKSLV